MDLARTLWRQGLRDRDVAVITGVPVRTVAHWRLGDRRTTRRAVHCPVCHGAPLPHEAYAYLLGLYLGDGHISRNRRDVYALSISCANAWPGLISEADHAMTAVMPRSRVCRVLSTGCTVVKSWSKHWRCLFPQHGPGRKHERHISLAPWQQSIVDLHPRDFVRGLFHSDGCRSINRVSARLGTGTRMYAYPRYSFVNRSQDILEILGATLDRLRVPWRYVRPDVISVARRSAVAILDDFVGPKY